MDFLFLLLDYYYTWYLYYGTCTKNINQKEGTNNTALQEERTAKKEEEEVVEEEHNKMLHDDGV